MAALLGWRPDAAFAATIIAATVGVAGLLQLLILVSRQGNVAAPLRISFDAQMRGFLGKAIPGTIANAALCSIQGITAADIGIINILDVSTFVEILNNQGERVLQELQNTPIKGRLRKVSKADR